MKSQLYCHFTQNFSKVGVCSNPPCKRTIQLIFQNFFKTSLCLQHSSIQKNINSSCHWKKNQPFWKSQHLSKYLQNIFKVAHFSTHICIILYLYGHRIILCYVKWLYNWLLRMCSRHVCASNYSQMPQNRVHGTIRHQPTFKKQIRAESV